MKSKYFNDIMSLAAFVLSVVCLATTRDIYTSMDVMLAWMGVVCFGGYWLREPIMVMWRKLARREEEQISP